MYADKHMKVINHRGIVSYVRKELAGHVFDTSYNKCHYMYLTLDFAPSFVIIGRYIIQPEGSKNFDEAIFSELSTLLLSWKLIPIMGGDDQL